MDAALRLRSIPDCGGNSGHTGSGAAKSNRTSRIFENEEETCKRHWYLLSCRRTGCVDDFKRGGAKIVGVALIPFGFKERSYRFPSRRCDGGGAGIFCLVFDRIIDFA